ANLRATSCDALVATWIAAVTVIVCTHNPLMASTGAPVPVKETQCAMREWHAAVASAVDDGVPLVAATVPPAAPPNWGPALLDSLRAACCFLAAAAAGEAVLGNARLRHAVTELQPSLSEQHSTMVAALRAQGALAHHDLPSHLARSLPAGF